MTEVIKSSKWANLTTIIVAIVGSVTTITVTLINVSKTSSIGNTIDSTAQKINKTYTSITEKVEGLPIGSIIASPLSYAKLLNLTGSEKFDPSITIWAPCDGREVIGSTYSDNYNEFTPDLRGQFLRGLNEFYTTGAPKSFANGNDPDARDTWKSYSYQKEEIKWHNHKLTDPGHAHSVGGLGKERPNNGGDHGGVRECCNGGSALTLTAANAATNITIDGIGGKETRPRNMAVYYYIKIN